MTERPMRFPGPEWGIFSNHAQALVEAQDWAWNTVFWGFCFALVFGAGSRPYLWRGQTTPGSWEKVEAE